jgi:hypothetical protein
VVAYIASLDFIVAEVNVSAGTRALLSRICYIFSTHSPSFPAFRDGDECRKAEVYFSYYSPENGISVI